MLKKEKKMACRWKHTPVRGSIAEVRYSGNYFTSDYRKELYLDSGTYLVYTGEVSRNVLSDGTYSISRREFVISDEANPHFGEKVLIVFTHYTWGDAVCPELLDKIETSHDPVQKIEVSSQDEFQALLAEYAGKLADLKDLEKKIEECAKRL